MNKTIDYTTSGTCSRRIHIELDGDIVKSVAFEGGCHGNTQGIAALVAGMKAQDVIERCRGLNCKDRGTSCPDQLARALEQILKL